MDSISDHSSARRHCEQALALLRDLGYQGQVALCILNRGRIHLVAGNQDEGRGNFKEALGLFRALDDPHGTLMSLCWLGRIAVQSGDLSEAEDYLSEIIKRAGELDRPIYAARGLEGLGMSTMLLGQYDDAEKWLLDARRIAHQCGALDVRCNAIQLLGETAWYRGNVDHAERRWNELLALARQVIFAGYENQALRWLSYVACSAGDYGRAEALCEQILSNTAEGDNFLRGLATLALARIALFRGKSSLAVERFGDCLRLLHSTWDWLDWIRAIEGLSWALAALERYDETARFLGFLAVDRERRGMILPTVDRPHHERALSLAREGLSEEVFSAAWKAGAALTLEDAVELALGL